jgi:1-acyl-sn-glycerol-3-phosphate acyltransferase
MRWHIVLVAPVPLRCVVIFYPHTSNWDFPIGLLTKWAVDVRFRWVGKDSLFRGPLAPLLRRLGGIAVNRRIRTGFTERLADESAQHVDFRVVIAPEGTRSRTERWRSGFYHLARTAGMPLALAFIDYPRREIGIGAYLNLTGDVVADMDRIRAFYAGKEGHRVAHQGVIRLRDEEPMQSAVTAAAPSS